MVCIYLRQEEWHSDNKYTEKEMGKLNQKKSLIKIIWKKNLHSQIHKPMLRERKEIMKEIGGGE